MSKETEVWEDPESPFYGLTPNWKPTYERPVPSFRCTGTTQSGERCRNKAYGFDDPAIAVCVSHGGNREEVKHYKEQVLGAARDRLLEFVPSALNKLQDIMEDEETPAQVQLNAAKEILDRAGIRGGVEIEVSVSEGKPPSEIVLDKILSMRSTKSDELEDLGETDGVLEEGQEEESESA